MGSILDHISKFPEFYGATMILVVTTPALVFLMRSRVGRRHQTGLIIGMAFAASPGSMVLLFAFAYGLAFSPLAALGLSILAMPFVVVPALIGGCLGLATSLKPAI